LILRASADQIILNRETREHSVLENAAYKIVPRISKYFKIALSPIINNTIMKKLSQLFALLALTFVSSSVFAQFTQPQMVAEWQRAKNYTKTYLDAMPEDGYGFKPTPEIRSFAQQMLHLSDADYIFATVASGKANPVGETLAAHNVNEKTVSPTKEAVTKAVMDSYDFVISTLQNMTPDQLMETTTFGKHENVSKGVLYAKAFEHQTHQRGQTTIYLRLKGVTPPAEQLF
jgi:uncharacterized damage-inducible protein DinB